MTVTNRSMGNAQVRISTKSRQGVLWACVLVLAVFGGACALSPCAMAQVSAAAQAEIDKFCAKHGTDVKKTEDRGSTLLHVAAQTAGVDVVRFLIEKGADVNAKRTTHASNDDVTPLYYAACNLNSEVIKFLIENGAVDNAKNRFGEVPLHYAARMNPNPEVAKVLIENGADVNAKTVYGATPLHDATQRNPNPEVAKLLIEKGSDINAKDRDGKTPLQVAKNANVREYFSKAVAQAQRRACLASAIDLNAEIKKNGFGSISEYVQYGESDLRKKLKEGDEFDQADIKAQIEAKKAAIFIGRYSYSTSNVKVEGDVSSVTITLDTGFAVAEIGEFVSQFPDIKCTAHKLSRQQSSTAFTLSGKTDSIKELVRGKDGYHMIVWFTNLKKVGTKQISADVVKIEIVKQ